MLEKTRAQGCQRIFGHRELGLRPESLALCGDSRLVAPGEEGREGHDRAAVPERQIPLCEWLFIALHHEPSAGGLRRQDDEKTRGVLFGTVQVSIGHHDGKRSRTLGRGVQREPPKLDGLRHDGDHAKPSLRAAQTEARLASGFDACCVQSLGEHEMPSGQHPAFQLPGELPVGDLDGHGRFHGCPPL